MDRFNKQLETENIPFKDIIIANESFVSQLYNEFKALPLKPDVSLYTGSKMDLVALSKEFETIRPPLSQNKDKNSFIMANFYSMGKLESQFNDLKNEFSKLKEVDIKYCGAFIMDAPMINTLKELDHKINLFEKYVINNNKDFVEYAKTKAKEVIAILNKLDNKDLKNQLLNKIINSNSNNEIFVDGISFDLNMNLSIKPNDDLLLSYDALKGYFNEVLENELVNIDKPVKAKPTKPEPFKTLEDAAVSKEAEAAIYQILINAELIDQDTNIFKDKTAGTLGMFYSTLIIFNEKGYYKRKPSINEYLNICKNSFKIEPSQSLAKNHKTRAKGLQNIVSFSHNP